MKLRSARMSIVPQKQGPVEKETWLSPDQRSRIAQWLEDGELVCACDASVEEERKAVAVWLGTKCGGDNVMIAASVQGLPHDSGRAEMLGPVIVMETLIEVREEYGITGEVDVWSDSAELVGFSESPRVANLPSRSCARNIDLELRWAKAQENLEPKVAVKKLKAHQDKETKYEDLTFEAQRNVDCDAKAGQKVKEVEKREYTDEVAPEVGALLWCSRGGITGGPYKWMLEQEAQTIVQKRLKMSERVFNEIDWNVHEGALKGISSRERRLLKRMLWGELPTGKKLERNGYREDSKFASCEEGDGTKHFLQCKTL